MNRTSRPSVRLARWAGFTLIEMLVTVCLIAVVATFSLPSLSAGLRSHSLSSATRATTSYVRLVRAMAIARHTRARLAVSEGNLLAVDVYDPATGSWSRAGTGVALSGGVLVTAVTPNAGVVFEREGTASAAGTVRLRNPIGDERVLTISILGVVEPS